MEDFYKRSRRVRIQLLLREVEGRNPLTNSDIRFLVGKEGLAVYEVEVSEARKERNRCAKTLVQIGDGNVPQYLAAVDRAIRAMAQQLRDGRFKSKAAIGTARHRKAEAAWNARRAECLVLQEQLDEYWKAVEERHHDAFHAPPEGGWGDKGAIIAELQWPPHLLKTELEHRPEPHLTDIPLHQQRDLIIRELEKLKASDPPAASGLHLQARASIRARAAS